MARRRARQTPLVFLDLSLLFTWLVGFSAAFISIPLDSCLQARNCSQCLDLSPSCQWCADENELWEGRRCQRSFSGCTEIHSPQSTQRPTEGHSKAFDETVQVTPQRFTVRIRPEQSVQLKINLQPAANYPLDVYYLMDHSFSMFDDLETLQKQAVSIASAIQSVSTNYRIGYGSYVDKTTAPFSVAHGPELMSPCTGCSVPYSFQNSVPLTSNVEMFRRKLVSEVISGSIDDPEGTLEAMVQVAVCQTEIGWRNSSRHVMVVATDAYYHTAGDGRLAGILSPNDGLCHLNSSTYIAGLTQDYPSISFVNHILQEKDILPIFTVTKDVMFAYKALAKEIPGSVVVTLTENSSNIVSILTSELSKLSQVAKVNVLPHPGVDIMVTAECPNGPATVDKATGFQKCDGMKVGQLASFTVNLTAGKCEILKNLKNVTIRFVGFGDVVIDIDPLCRCECERNPVVNSSWCSYRGVNYCGVCECKESFRDQGGRCDCSLNSTEPCMEPSSQQVCSGRGSCICSQCQCFQPAFSSQRIYGRFCECDNFTCPTDNLGRVCGGSLQGDCECGICTCKEGFCGEDCGCPCSNDSCKADGEENRLCKGEGVCECGKCICVNGFSGIHCNLCVLSPEECHQISACGRAIPCLTCPTDSNDEKCSKCGGFRLIDPPATLPHFIEGVEAKQCERMDEDGCYYYYWVAVDSEDMSFHPVEIENKKSCPEDFDYLPLLLGILFGLVLLGLLLLLLWRACVYYKDLQEFKRFQLSRKTQSIPMGESPLYRNPITTYPNLQYKRK